jgi:HPt (histidine-containing phosphotransfer) domain-containing protein
LVMQEVIDLRTYTELKELMGADFMTEIADTYFGETGELIEQLRMAYMSEDAPAFGRLAHSIKSSSASLGALAFSQQARQLEMVGKAGDISGAGALLDLLAAAFLEVKQTLEELKNEP